MIPAALIKQSRRFVEAQLAQREGIHTKDFLPESQVYIGLNDSETKEQIFETGRYVSILKEVCHEFGVPFSLDVIEGGYIHDDGTFTEEKSIVLTFIDVEQKTIDEIARKVCALFNQESVLITTEHIHVRSVRMEASED